MIQVVARAVIANEGRYMLVKLRGEDFWCLPGGKASDTEDIQSALKRELIEELGIEPTIGNLLYIHQFININKDKQRLEFFFEVVNGRDYAGLDLSETSHGQQELAAAEFVDIANERVLPAFLVQELATHTGETRLKTSVMR